MKGSLHCMQHDAISKSNLTRKALALHPPEQLHSEGPINRNTSLIQRKNITEKSLRNEVRPLFTLLSGSLPHRYRVANLEVLARLVQFCQGPYLTGIEPQIWR